MPWNVSNVLLALALAPQSPQTPPPQPPRRIVAGDRSEVKPIYRELKPGEERFEGQLQRIVCPPGKPVTFVVKGKDRVAMYTASRLTAVDYIAHNPNFRGPVSCGGYTPAEHVFVIWKKVDGASRAVAIEFLPPQ
jgi:hypothetical protein